MSHVSIRILVIIATEVTSYTVSRYDGNLLDGERGFSKNAKSTLSNSFSVSRYDGNLLNDKKRLFEKCKSQH